ncbi:MAG: NADAR family protein [Sphingomonadales bacterium]
MTERFTFFARNPSPFSQWYEDAPFELDGIRFATAEHYMMFRKGQLFGAPDAMLQQILAATPRGARALGRQVPGFKEQIWRPVARTIVAAGNYAKFTQNPPALWALLETEGTTLVEAAPWDRVWGIGLAANDPRSQQRDTWLGLNWLGHTLTDVRDTLLRAIRAGTAAPV